MKIYFIETFKIQYLNTRKGFKLFFKIVKLKTKNHTMNKTFFHFIWLGWTYSLVRFYCLTLKNE